MIDFANRAWNTNRPMNPIVRSLLDTDFYVITMGQLEWEKHPNVIVEFSFKNRSTNVRLADEIDVDELRQQLDYVRSLRVTPTEIIWLRGQTFYGQSGIFKEGYLNALRALTLPEYDLRVEDGQIELKATGPWWQVAMWEMPFMTIVNELRYRGKMAKMTKAQLDRMYARAKVKLHDKLLRLVNECPNLNLTDFGTRRRHSFLWQEYAVLMAKDVLGDRFTGTSNVHIAMKHDLEAKGSNAHQLPMCIAALASAQGDTALRESQYSVLKEWQNTYQGNMLIFLPDTFGTTQFLKGAPQWLVNWKGARPDSKEPISAGEELIDWWTQTGVSDLKSKLILFSDGLDVHLPNYTPNGDDIVSIYNHFKDRVGIGFGWGTNLTADFRECSEIDDMLPLSLVAKPTRANGLPTVKLSDNPGKASSVSVEEIAHYIKVFGIDGAISQELKT